MKDGLIHVWYNADVRGTKAKKQPQQKQQQNTFSHNGCLTLQGLSCFLGSPSQLCYAALFARTLSPAAMLPVTCMTAACCTLEPKWQPRVRREWLRSAVCLGRLSRWPGDSVSRRRRTGAMQSQLAAVASQVIGQSWWVPQCVTAVSRVVWNWGVYFLAH